jgi:hypothetical protein
MVRKEAGLGFIDDSDRLRKAHGGLLVRFWNVFARDSGQKNEATAAVLSTSPGAQNLSQFLLRTRFRYRQSAAPVKPQAEITAG